MHENWFVKAKRAQNKNDYETWNQGGVSPTLSAFDNGDTRATVIIFQAPETKTIKNNSSHIGFSHSASSPSVDSKLFPTIMAGHDRMPSVSDSIGVRRLTPVECERLQGFPDDWTKHRLNENKDLIEQADSPRYKQMGNAVAVPCVEWIVNRLVAE
jgi:site-specific DNA-cytosine methylase